MQVKKKDTTLEVNVSRKTEKKGPLNECPGNDSIKYTNLQLYH